MTPDRRTPRILATLLALGACGPSPCEPGEVRDAGPCVPYSADDPVRAEGVWRPSPGTSWQWQLSGAVEPTRVPAVDMIDVDLFDVSASTIAALQAEDRVVICYFSAGSVEDWRPDIADLAPEAIGRVLDGWPDERWLDVTDATVRALAASRLDRAVQKGCDGVEPDNVDAWDNATGLPLNTTEQLAFNRFLADEAHRRSLSVGLKNDLDQLEALVDWFDWGLNEECASFDECERLAVFTGVGKAVFHVEYVDRWEDAAALAEDVCGVGPSLDTLIKEWDLGAERLACD